VTDNWLVASQFEVYIMLDQILDAPQRWGGQSPVVATTTTTIAIIII
jgi:hypothetical protein